MSAQVHLDDGCKPSQAILLDGSRCHGKRTVSRPSDCPCPRPPTPTPTPSTSSPANHLEPQPLFGTRLASCNPTESTIRRSLGISRLLRIPFQGRRERAIESPSVVQGNGYFGKRGNLDTLTRLIPATTRVISEIRLFALGTFNWTPLASRSRRNDGTFRLCDVTSRGSRI